MLRKLLTGAAVLVLPLTGLAITEGAQVGNAAPQAAATLHCPSTTASGLTSGGVLEFGAAAAANVHLDGTNTTVGETQIPIIEPVIKTGVAAPGQSYTTITETQDPAVVGQEVIINKQTDWITAVESRSYYGTLVPAGDEILVLENPIASVADNKPGNGVFPTSASPPTTYQTIKLQATTATNTIEGVHGYTSYTGEGYDPPSVKNVAMDSSLTASSCSLETNSAVSDFYPNSASATYDQTYASNAVTNFEGKSPALTATVTWPPSSGGYVNNGTATLEFAPGRGIVCTGGAPDETFDQDAAGLYQPGSAGEPGDATPCSLGQDIYLKGSMTGTYSGSRGTVIALSLSGLVLCSYDEIVVDGDTPSQCYGGPSNGGSSEASSIITDLITLEDYDGTNGTCDNATDSSVTYGGVTTPACSAPTAADGSGILGIGGYYESGVVNF